jgi:NAD(P)-dependent dehydrogenase (short-subunit alcohol dehydrogenase family)
VKLKDKVVVVTGGGGLLGRAFVKAIADAGGIAVLADVSEEAGRIVAESLRATVTGGTVVFEPLDITKRSSVDQLVANVSARYGRIDALVNSAYPRGKHYGRALPEVEYDDFCETVSLHLGGYFLTSQRFALFFREQGWGNVVTVASIYGVVAPRFDVYEGTPMTMPVEYAVVKSALIHLSRYFMRYFSGSPIRFNCLSPGGILDAQSQRFRDQYAKYAQHKGMLNPDDIVGAALFLLSDDSTFINGQNLVIDDGWTV